MKYKDCPQLRTCLQGETQCIDPKCPLNASKNKSDHEQHVEGLSKLLRELMKEKDNERDG